MLMRFLKYIALFRLAPSVSRTDAQAVKGVALAVACCLLALLPTAAWAQTTPRGLYCANIDSFNYGEVTVAPNAKGYLVTLKATDLFDSTDRADLAEISYVHRIRVQFKQDECRFSTDDSDVMSCRRTERGPVILDLNRRGGTKTLIANWFGVLTERVTRIGMDETREQIEAIFTMGSDIAEPNGSTGNPQGAHGIIPFTFGECSPTPPPIDDGR